MVIGVTVDAELRLLAPVQLALVGDVTGGNPTIRLSRKRWVLATEATHRTSVPRPGHGTAGSS